MRKIKQATIVLLVLALQPLVVPLAVAKEAGFAPFGQVVAQKLKVNKNGIKVWVSSYEGSKILGFKGTRVVESNLSGVVATIMDTQSLSEWVPYTQSARVIEKNDKNGTFVLHMIMALPFPLANRDVVVKGYWLQDAKGNVTIYSKSIPDARVPLNPKMVRITNYEGGWVLKALDAKRVEVTVLGITDPAGAIPVGIANQFVQVQPFEMLKRLPNAVKGKQQEHVPLVQNAVE